MSIRKRAKDWWREHSSSQKNLPQKTPEQTLAEHSVQIAKGTEIRERVAALADLEEELTKEVQTKTLGEYLSIWKDRTNILFHACIQIASPYARSGTSEVYARKLLGLTQYKGVSDEWFQEAEEIIDQENAETLIKMMVGNIQKYIFPDLFYYLSVCFQDPDIATQAVAVIQSVMPVQPPMINPREPANKPLGTSDQTQQGNKTLGATK